MTKHDHSSAYFFLVLFLVYVISFLFIAAAEGDTMPEYVTMKDGSVCEIPLYGNSGKYSPQNYLGLDYDNCESPGLANIYKLSIQNCPVVKPLPECNERKLVVSPTQREYPCIDNGPE